MNEQLIHANDFMYFGGPRQDHDYYMAVGDGACDLIENQLREASINWSKLRSVLDFGSGYGRVTRHLCKRVHPKQIWAFDVDNEGSTFCQDAFGVNRVEFGGDWEGLHLGVHDLIWVGSVFTHLSPYYIEKMLLVLAKSLSQDGLLLITVHGRHTMPRIASGFYGESIRLQYELAITELDTNGVFFVPYSGSEIERRTANRTGVANMLKERPIVANEILENYGKSWLTPHYLEETLLRLARTGMHLRIASYQAAAWDSHQDVFCLRKIIPSVPING